MSWIAASSARVALIAGIAVPVAFQRASECMRTPSIVISSTLREIARVYGFNSTVFPRDLSSIVVIIVGIMK